MANISEPALGHDFLDLSESLSRLHPVAVTGRESVHGLLKRVLRESIQLQRGMNHKILPEVAQIKSLNSKSLVLQTSNFADDVRHRIFLNFSIDARPYFFTSLFLEKCDEITVRIEMPAVIYQSERRDRHRSAPQRNDPRRVAIWNDSYPEEQGEIVDSSPQGMGIALKKHVEGSLGSNCRVRFLDGNRKGQLLFGEIRQIAEIPNRVGWVHVGLDVSSTKREARLVSASVESIDSYNWFSRAIQRWKMFAAAAKHTSQKALEKVGRVESDLPDVRVVEFFNDQNERITAIVNSTGDTRGAPVVVIPPAWGKTKESLMPLALCILSSFASSRMPLVVIRFDGIRKRGESHNEAASDSRHSDHHRFTFSQGVRDIKATVDYLERSPEFACSKIIVVSFSAAAIETRRAVADDPRISGWVSVVGASDLQSMMRVISGGIDFASGLEKGISFGLQEILGIEVDMDRAGLDAFRHDLVYLDDARRDMDRITVPITWIHGKYDAWMCRDRALDALSRGSIEERKFVEVPTGHILRTSQEALETFQLVTQEVSRMVLGWELKPTLPDLGELQSRGRAERNRLHKGEVTLQEFWREYLVGKSADIGIELMTSIGPYQDLMRIQAHGLRLKGGEVVVDLGSGTGSFPQYAASNRIADRSFQVVEVDFVREGFARTRERFGLNIHSLPFDLQFVESDLNLNESGGSLPLETGSADAVIASLLISYVKNPDVVLTEIFRVLKPGGRLVVSSLRRDADMSKLYMEGIDELRLGLARERFGESGEKEIEAAARSYLNQASKLLDLEEGGAFQFWDAEDLVAIVRAAGFRQLETRRSLGSPPQAVVISATRR